MSAPPPPVGSAKIYMTPQLAKRRDGLAPSLLPDNVSPAGPSNGSVGAAISKCYETSSRFLKAEVRDLENEAEELKFIVDSINHFLKELVDERKQTTDLISMKFQPKGAVWACELNPSLGAPSYHIQVVCMAKGGGNNQANNQTTYMVDTMLVSKDPKTVGSTSLPGFREAKGCFDFTALQVRKAVVKCEFPDFPEGCKGRAFREVYQLNARVRFVTLRFVTFRFVSLRVSILYA
jgi:hypothetical protein